MFTAPLAKVIVAVLGLAAAFGWTAYVVEVQDGSDPAGQVQTEGQSMPGESSDTDVEIRLEAALRELASLQELYEQSKNQSGGSSGDAASENIDSDASKQELMADLSAAMTELNALRLLYQEAKRDTLQADSGESASMASANSGVLAEDLASAQTELEATQLLNDALKGEIDRASDLINTVQGSEKLQGVLDMNSENAQGSTANKNFADYVQFSEVVADLVQFLEETSRDLEKLDKAEFQVSYLETRLKYASEHLRRLRVLRRQTQEENQMLAMTIESVKQELGEGQQEGISVATTNEGMFILTLETDILFDSGSALLTNSGRDTLRSIYNSLKEHPERYISLEGHTDNVQISSRLSDIYPTNWELSSARAASAAKLLISEGFSPDKIRIVGYSDLLPIASNDSDEGRAKNRRIEIRLYPQLQDVTKS